MKRRPGRPPIHEESWTKVTVVLFDRQVAFLDEVAANIRTQHGTTVSRAQLIRALIDSVRDTADSSPTSTGLDPALLARLGIGSSDG